MKKEEVYSSPKVTDDVTLSELSILNQIKLLFSRLSNSASKELDSQKKLNDIKMRRIASLRELLDQAIKPLYKDKKKVVISLSSEYLIYLDEVINSRTGLGRYYDISILNQKDIDDKISGIRFKILLSISKREGDTVANK